MKYIKKNKLTVFIIVIFVLVVIVGAYLYNIFFGSGKESYRNRLDRIQEIEITDNKYDEIKTSLQENEGVTSVTTRLQGKIVNVTITVANDVTKDNAKKIANGILEYLDEDQLMFYDIQVFVKKENEELNDFPIIGYKQNNEEGFTWTKDRQVTTDETE